jgi:hypothetical protein
MGSGIISSPRRALDKIPPRSRARMKWSSASYADPPVMPTARQELVVVSVAAYGCPA